MSQVLVVDDDAGVRTLLGEALRTRGHAVQIAADGRQALSLAERQAIDLVILDMVLPGVDGLQVLRDLREHRPATPVIMITGHASVGSAISAMKMGAFDYIVKPFRLDEVELVIAKALGRGGARPTPAARLGAPEIIGRSPAMRRVLDLIERIAPTRSTVLITGPSGSGKELVARAIHARSERSNGPFVGVNCGALPDSLLEDELFGHVRGAFTDAVADRAGRFEQAHGGTLFLDEIGTMSPGLQVRLLRVLQEREVCPLGSTRRVRVDVRIVCATHQDVRQAVERGEFREDLFYRLNVIQVALPPLRERQEDIPLLLRHFLQRHALAGTEPRRFSREAMRVLGACSWPGNVRQLENVVERSLALSGHGGDLDVQDLPEEVLLAPDAGAPATDASQGGLDLERQVRDFEERMITRALEDTGWIKTRAASRLKIKRTTLIEKMKRLGIPLRARPSQEPV
jgi:DNA-binding NtrC family response regulator